MKSLRSTTLVGGLLSLGLFFAPRAEAVQYTNPATLDLQVTFTSVLSINVDGVQYSTRTLGALVAGQTFVPASSATVTNDSQGLTEKIQLSGADVSTTGVTLWSLVTSTGPAGSAGGVFCAGNPGSAGCPSGDQYALQALFISSAAASTCPINTATDWDVYMSTVGATPTTYTSHIYADATVVGNASGLPDQTTGTHDGNMFSNVTAVDGRGKRGLCVRLTMPSSSTSVGQHTIRLTMTAVAGQ